MKTISSVLLGFLRYERMNYGKNATLPTGATVYDAPGRAGPHTHYYHEIGALIPHGRAEAVRELQTGRPLFSKQARFHVT